MRLNKEINKNIKELAQYVKSGKLTTQTTQWGIQGKAPSQIEAAWEAKGFSSRLSSFLVFWLQLFDTVVPLQHEQLRRLEGIQQQPTELLRIRKGSHDVLCRIVQDSLRIKLGVCH